MMMSVGVFLLFGGMVSVGVYMYFFVKGGELIGIGDNWYLCNMVLLKL